MKRALKYLFLVIGVLLGLALVVMAVLNVIALNRLNQRYELSLIHI